MVFYIIAQNIITCYILYRLDCRKTARYSNNGYIIDTIIDRTGFLLNSKTNETDLNNATTQISKGILC